MFSFRARPQTTTRSSAALSPDARTNLMRKRGIIVAAVVVAAAVSFVAISRATSASSAASGAAPLRTADGTGPGVTAQRAGARLHLVVLGDSIAKPSSCPGCSDFADLYAKAVEKATGKPVEVDNRAAIELSNVPPGQVTEVLAHVYADDSLRRALTGADIVLINVGFNDTAWARFDDPCDVAPNFPVVRWRHISDGCIQRVTHEYKQTLDEILTQIDELRGCGAQPGVPPCSQRGKKDTLLRVVTVFNDTIGDTIDPGWNSPQAARISRRGTDLMVRAQCEVTHFHGGRCADVYHAINGPHGTRAPERRYVVNEGPHLSQKGHQLVARTLANLGYSPLMP